MVLRLDKPRLLTGMIDKATELKTSVASIMEHTQILVEIDTSGSTSQMRERFACHSFVGSTNHSGKISMSQFRESPSTQSFERSATEFRAEDTQESCEESANESSISFLFTSTEKLKVKAKNVRLTSRELAQTLRKYTFLSDERIGERNCARGVNGTPLSNKISRVLRDRTFAQQTSPRSPPESFQVFRSSESPL